MPFFTAKAAETPQRICVAALAATTGPRVTKNPKVEAEPTKPATKGPTQLRASRERVKPTWLNIQ